MHFVSKIILLIFLINLPLWPLDCALYPSCYPMLLIQHQEENLKYLYILGYCFLYFYWMTGLISIFIPSDETKARNKGITLFILISLLLIPFSYFFINVDDFKNKTTSILILAIIFGLYTYDLSRSYNNKEPIWRCLNCQFDFISTKNFNREFENSNTELMKPILISSIEMQNMV
jgi:hypothetical protein